MKLTLVMAMSADGKITRANESNVGAWSSPEDKKKFSEIRKQFSCIIMGRKMFESVKDKMKLSPDKLRLVVTRHPELYADLTVEGQLEFTSDSPEEIVGRAESLGHNKALLLGGPELTTAFFASQLVNELVLTIEPLMFGEGLNLLSNFCEVSLQLQSVEQINERGTLMCHYKVL